METSKRRLIVLLCMHRSGSSLTASILSEVGMSLGPYDLVGAAPGNPHGHFESVPFNLLNKRVLDWAIGFRGDVPHDFATLSRILESEGVWTADRAIPAELLDEGERVVRGLVESGLNSGFKDPRTVLAWPFWRRVFERVENLEIAPVLLVRSPHEIAMSLCARSEDMSYWNALDMVGVHLSRMRAISEEFPERPPVVRFATPSYWSDLRELANRYGLNWSDEAVERVYRPSSVHQLPAVVAHPAQKRYDELCGGEPPAFDPEANALRLAEDARRAEAGMYARLRDSRREYWETRAKLQRLERALSLVGPFLAVASSVKKRTSGGWPKLWRRRRENGTRSASTGSTG